MKTALVTGASGGIGSAIVIKLLGLGFRVCATDVHIDRLQDLTGKVPTEGSRNLEVFKLDVTHREEIRQAIETHPWTSEGVDLLINNAGRYERALAAQIEEEQFKEILDINLLGPFRMVQAILPKMVARGGGRIINISSIAALKGLSEASHYSSSKAALIAFSKSIALELASKNIQVNCVLPGFIDTPMTRGQKDLLRNLAALRIPARRIGLPEDVANTVGFLASENASYMTGSEIIVDGGYSIA